MPGLTTDPRRGETFSGYSFRFNCTVNPEEEGLPIRLNMSFAFRNYAILPIENNVNMNFTIVVNDAEVDTFQFRGVYEEQNQRYYFTLQSNPLPLLSPLLASFREAETFELRTPLELNQRYNPPDKVIFSTEAFFKGINGPSMPERCIAARENYLQEEAEQQRQNTNALITTIIGVVLLIPVFLILRLYIRNQAIKQAQLAKQREIEEEDYRQEQLRLQRLKQEEDARQARIALIERQKREELKAEEVRKAAEEAEARKKEEEENDRLEGIRRLKRRYFEALLHADLLPSDDPRQQSLTENIRGLAETLDPSTRLLRYLPPPAVSSPEQTPPPLPPTA